VTAFLFDLDGTLVDSVYQHVLAWRQALEETGIELAVWKIHRKIGMSGGLFANALLRETGRPFTAEQAEQLARALGVGLLSGGCGLDELQSAGAYRVYDDPADLLRHLDEVGVRDAE
jgi:phosphoglycolate phosphatase-like HAD superfamily hydrolase